VAAILLLVLIVHHTNNGMRVLQSNIQSINTSVPPLRQCSHRLHAETILLQEIWHPIDGHINIRNYSIATVKLRNGREGGGVAIITHNSVRTLHKADYEVDGLEAVWDDVMDKKVRMIVGSVYIPPGDVKALELLDDVISRILLSNIGMDSNSHSTLWDDKSIGISPYCKLKWVIHCISGAPELWMWGAIASSC